MVNLGRLARSPRHQPHEPLENDERPLPLGWHRAISNNVVPGKVYYTNGIESRWKFPNQEENQPFIQLQPLEDERRARFQELRARIQEHKARIQKREARSIQEREARIQKRLASIEAAEEDRRLDSIINGGPNYLSVETRRALALLPAQYTDPRLESWKDMFERYEFFFVISYDIFGNDTGGQGFSQSNNNRTNYEYLTNHGTDAFILLGDRTLRPGQQDLPLTSEQEVQLQNLHNVFERCSLEKYPKYPK